MQINQKRRLLVSGIGAALMTPFIPRGFANSLPPLTGNTMGTKFKVVLGSHPRDASLRDIRQRILAVLESTESLMSIHRNDSELSRLNRNSGLQPFELAKKTQQVIENALLIRKQSEGAFDPLAGDLVRHWGFGPAQSAQLPDRETQPYLPRPGGAVWWQDNQLVKSHGNVTLDLNGIAKGNAIDRISKTIENFNIHRYLIEIGGEIYANDMDLGVSPWQVGIAHPEGGIDRVIGLTNQALATSGDYIDFYELAGKRISHLVDPRSGLPVDNKLASVSVICSSAMEADAWATALMVLGPEDGLSAAVEFGLAASFMLRGSNGYRRILTPGFESYYV